MKIAITGACGWLGNIVADHLQSIGHEIFRIDKPSLSGGGIIGWNIRDHHKTAPSLPKQVDAVFHFAAAADVNKINEMPIRAILDNVLGVGRVLEWIREIKPERFFLISSMWAASWPQNNHPYTTSKRLAEDLVYSWYLQYSVPFSILRLGTCYGPGGRGGTVITNFVKKALNNETLTVYGTGTASRRYLYVDDLARMCESVLEANEHRYFNLCGPQETSVAEVAKIVRQIVRSVPIHFLSARPGDLASEETSAGYRAVVIEKQTSLEDGIKKYMDWLGAQEPKETTTNAEAAITLG